MKTVDWKKRVQVLVTRLGTREAVAAKIGVSYWSVVGWLTKGTKPSRLAQERIAAIEEGE